MWSWGLRCSRACAQCVGLGLGALEQRQVHLALLGLRGVRRGAVLVVVDAVLVAVIRWITGRGRGANGVNPQLQVFLALHVGRALFVHRVGVVAALADDAGAAAEPGVHFHALALHILHGVDVGPAVGCMLDADHVVVLGQCDLAGQQRGISEPLDHALTEHRDDDLPLALLGEAPEIVDDDTQRAVAHLADVPGHQLVWQASARRRAQMGRAHVVAVVGAGLGRV